ncbi:sn-glycerol-1-phosphate dehydrogenase [Paenibacillus sp. 1P07SE]|uniref:sn-glycerol-1-phosphate dehydrogenase n=1 Tax=Paenibacillus sp. 1P07SE TaxID=3132209 RepID=UPI0039A46D0D
MIERITKLTEACPCNDHHPIGIDAIVVEAGALEQITGYLKSKGCKHINLVVDSLTYEAAGRRVESLLTEGGIGVSRTTITANSQGDVVADEQSLVQLMLELSPDTTEMIVVVGAGTLHDIARFAAYKMGKPFLSVPTAPSVDGFNSKGAPLLVRGIKITVPASAPVAIFADLDVLMQAPQAMIAAGFGDMLGKYTSLFDWSFSHKVADEPYCEAAAEITRSALQTAVDHADSIGRREPDGIRVLMNSLIESGLAMLIFGLSHPASGAEHHLSHYWEMECLRLGSKQLLHGAKVGVACAEISDLYHKLGQEQTWARALPQDAWEEERLQRLRTVWPELAAELARVPAAEQLRSWLRTARGPDHIAALGVSEELRDRSLREAHHVRPRYTMLRAINLNRVAGH